MSITFRRIAIIPAALATTGLTLGLAAPVAQAQSDLPGQHTGPVQFWADATDHCQVTFTHSNSTNGQYPLDWRIDGEPLRGPDYGTGATSHRRFNPAPNQPQFQTGVVGYRSDFVPLVSARTVTLTDLADLPDRGADDHNIEFRMILGPHTPHRGDGRWHTVAVTGCQTDTTSTLTAPTSAAPGVPVPLTVQVAPADANGTVQFYEDGAPFGEPVPVVGGDATIERAFAELGDRVLTAAFIPAVPAASDTPYAPSTTAPVTIRIAEPPVESGSLGFGSLGLLCGEDALSSASSTGSVSASCDVTVDDAPSGSLLQLASVSTADSGGQAE